MTGIIRGDDHNKAVIEAALFAAGRTLSLVELSELSGLKGDEVRALAGQLTLDYAKRHSGLEIRSSEGGYVMQVRASLAQDVVPVAPKEIEAPLIRTLAIIAYKQPVMQSDLAKVRGNRCYEHVRVLERMGLISAARKGRSKELRTTRGFADYFGLDSEDPEFVRHAIGVERGSVGVTPMYESLARRMGIDFVVVNPYNPGESDLERLREIDLLVLAPGYLDRVRQRYSGDVIEAGVRTLSQLKESVELICEAVEDCPDVEPLLAEIDLVLLDYRNRASRAAAVNPLTQMVADIAGDLRIPVSEDGISVAPDYSGLEAKITVPTHQDYGMDVMERIRQRYDALLDGLKSLS